MNQKTHWESIYASKPRETLGWYKPHLQTSLQWIRDLALPKSAPIIDVGGGASTLVDDLLDEGYETITVLDLSANALSQCQSRLGSKAHLVTWLTGDITRIDLPAQTYALWHDRAVFHFLTSPEQQAHYRDRLLTALQPGGHVIIGTFAPEAPPRCSGLPVERYDEEKLRMLLGKPLEVVRSHKELHTTPGGVEQMYLYCQFRKSET